MTMAQLQKELVHAMADRFEADVNISIVKAQIMAEEARQTRILELQQQEKNARMHLNILYLLSHQQGRKRATTNTTNGLTTLAVAASMPPPPFLDLTRRIPEALVATPRERLFDQYDPRYSVGVAEEDSKIEESIAADVALRRWGCGETNGNTSKAERGLYYDDDQGG
jgi:hypothetical protein